MNNSICSSATFKVKALSIFIRTLDAHLQYSGAAKCCVKKCHRMCPSYKQVDL